MYRPTKIATDAPVCVSMGTALFCIGGTFTSPSGKVYPAATQQQLSDYFAAHPETSLVEKDKDTQAPTAEKEKAK